jgi:uncharacterized membrane protein
MLSAIVPQVRVIFSSVFAGTGMGSVVHLKLERPWANVIGSFIGADFFLCLGVITQTQRKAIPF